MALAKICGLTRAEDMLACADAGADLVGLIVEVPRSPRCLTLEEAKALAAVSPVPVAVLLELPSPEFAVEVAQRCEAAAVQLVGLEEAEHVEAIVGALRSACQGKAPTIMVAVPLPAKDDPDSVPAPADIWPPVTPARLASAGADEIVLDTAIIDAMGGRAVGGTGRASNWELAREVADLCPVPVWLAGGLCPESVGEAISIVEPHGVDVSGGVEAGPGIKDDSKVRAFVATAHGSDGA